MGGGFSAERIGGEFLMADYLVTDTELTSIADAIRTKGGTSGSLVYPAGFVSAINAIPTGGGGQLIMGALRPDAELYQRYTFDQKLVADLGVTFPSYTTGLKVLVSSSTIVEITPLIGSGYDWLVLMRGVAIPSYNVSTFNRGREEYYCIGYSFEILSTPPNTFQAISNPAYKYAGNDVYVCGSTGATGYYYWQYANEQTYLAKETSNYGIYINYTAPSYNPRGVVTDTLRITSPVIYLKGNGTYFPSEYYSSLTDCRIQYIYEVYRVPRAGNSVPGWSATSQYNHIAGCISNGGTLT